MKKELDIHNYHRKVKAAVRAVKAASISEKNKEHILKFRDSCTIEGMSLARIERYLGVLRQLAGIMQKDFDAANKDDIVSLVRVIQEKEYSAWTKYTYKVMIKKFYKWLRGCTDEYPEEVKWIKPRVKATEMQLPGNGDLITKDDIQKLIKAANHPRDKALVAVLLETGGRIGEIGSLQIKNIQPDEHGAVLHVTGKTGPRPIPIVWSTPYLMTWMQCHPFEDDPDAPLWVNIGCKAHFQPMQYVTFNTVLKRLFAKAGIKKAHKPHMFRHSSATFMSPHLKEAQMNQYYGWVQGSRMPAVYVHMSGRDIKDSILEINGVAAKQEKQSNLIQPVICSACNTINPQDAKFCKNCAHILDVKTAVEMQAQRQNRSNADALMNKLLADPDVKQVLTQKISELEA